MVEQGSSAGESGFSLLEVLVASALTVMLMGFTLTALVQFDGVNGDLNQANDLQRRLRHAADLLKEEVGQAGSLGTVTTALTQSVSANEDDAQSVSIGSTQALYAGRKLLVGPPDNRETVVVESVGPSRFSAVFTKSHAAGEPVYTTGLLLGGVLSSSTSGELRMLGDVRGDGTLSQVIYQCTSTTLTRSETPVQEAFASPPVPVLEGLAGAPGGCFQYDTEVVDGTTVIAGVRASLAALADDGSVKTVTLHIPPRNHQLARGMALDGETQWLQDLPAALPAP